MALSTNLGRLRARIKKDLERRGAEPQTQAQSQAPSMFAAAPISRTPTAAASGQQTEGKGGANAIQKLGLKLGQQATTKGLQKLVGDLFEGTPSFNRGGSEAAFQDQRLGERMDFSNILAPGAGFENIGGLGASPADFQAFGGTGAEIAQAFPGSQGATSGAPGAAAVTSGLVSSLSSLAASLGPGAAAALVAAIPGLLQQAGVKMSPSEAAMAQGAANMAGTGAGIGASAAIGGVSAAAGSAVLALPALMIAGLNMYSDMKDAKKMENALKKLKQDLMGPISDVRSGVLQDVPKSYATMLGTGSSIENTKTSYQRSKYLQDLYNAYDTHIKGGGNTMLGGWKSMSGYTKGMEENLAPFMQMNEAAMLRGQDTLTNAGIDFDPFYAAEGNRNPIYSFAPKDFLDTNYYQRPNIYLDDIRKTQAGLGYTSSQIEENIQNALNAGIPNIGGIADQTIGPGGQIGLGARWDTDMIKGIQGAFTPGNFESGLRGLAQQYGFAISNPFLGDARGPDVGPAPTATGVAPAPTATGVAPIGGVAPLGSSGFSSLKGPTSELLTAEDPNRL